jgi:hypothetical protein
MPPFLLLFPDACLITNTKDNFILLTVMKFCESQIVFNWVGWGGGQISPHLGGI